MSVTSLGDLAQSFLLRRYSAESKAQIRDLSAELTTGVAQDKAAHLSGNLAPLAGLENALAQLRGYKTAALDLGTAAGAMQIALDTIGQHSSDLSANLLAATSSVSESRIATVAEEAARRLNTVVGALNTRFGDRSLFAGDLPNEPALIGSDALLDLLQGVVAGATGAPDAEALVDDWFDDPAGFDALAYRGGDPQGPIAIASGETAKLGLTAAEPTIKDMIRALVMPALLTRGLLAGQPGGQTDIAKRAGEKLLAGQSAWAEMAARLGTTEAQVDAAVTRSNAESSALEIYRAEMIGVDPFETATRLEAAQTQLETLYAITARMQRLNLADYL